MREHTPFLRFSCSILFLAACSAGVIVLICVWGGPWEALLKALATSLTVVVVSGVVLSVHRTACGARDET